MVRPNLIHPVQVDIEQIDKASTVFDPDTREPLQQAARSAKITIPGQPRWRRLDQVSMQRGGDRLEAKGYIVFRKEDMDALSIMVNINDKIVRIGHTEVEYFIVEREWIGHYPNFNGPSLLKAWFTDRAPSKRSNA